MPVVKHLNNSVYFIKKEIHGEQLILRSQARGEFDLAVSFTLLTNINQVALSISEQPCRSTQEYSSFECGMVGTVIVTFQPQYFLKVICW